MPAFKTDRQFSNAQKTCSISLHNKINKSPDMDLVIHYQTEQFRKPTLTIQEHPEFKNELAMMVSFVPGKKENQALMQDIEVPEEPEIRICEPQEMMDYF
jgi:hypothetical protein